MYKKKLIILAAGLFLPFWLLAQKHTISGYVEDAASGEKLIGAAVFDQVTGQGTTTNVYGYFSITLPEGTVGFTVSYVGYSPYNETITLKEDLVKTIELMANLELEEVVVTSNQPKDIVESSQMSTLTIKPGQIKSLPVFLGEPDVLKALQLMPGVQSGTEGTSGIYVRGGGPDQNLFLLDGVPLYNVNHLFGFFSVFNTDAISNINLIKGGFPARYGGRLSSVIDIRLKEGNQHEFHGAGSVGLISSRFMFEGPIIKEKSSFMLSLRRTYFDILARPIVRIINDMQGNDGTFGYYFYDLNLKVNYTFSPKDRLYLSLYSGKDKFYLTDEYDYINDDSTYTERYGNGLYWGNITSVLRWNHMYRAKFFSNVSLVYTNYTFDMYENSTSLINKRKVLENEFDYYSGIEDVGGIIDFDYHPSPQHDIKFGGKYLYHTFKPGMSVFTSTGLEDTTATFGNEAVNAHEAYVYLEDDMSIGSRIRLNAGLHYSMFFVDGDFYNSLQPRFSGRILLTKDLSLKASASRMQQNIHLLTNPTIGLPTDLWMPATGQLPPENSWQYALGAAYNFRNEWSVTLEGYYKTNTGIIEYKEGSGFGEPTADWQSIIDQGDGWSYGAELLLKKDLGKLSGWIGYTLAWSYRLVEGQNNGIKYPYTYDRRHDLSVVLMYKFDERTDVSATWIYGTGKAVTLGVARYGSYFDKLNVQNDYYYYYRDVQYYNGKNGFREPAYHRLDVSLNRHKKKPWGTQTWSFGAYNAYNHLNCFFLYFGYERNQRVLKQVSIFPIIPSISYAFSF